MHPYSYAMTERNGVRIGQRVRDVEGRNLGRVRALYEWGFAISRGFPILFRRDWVARYDEVRGVRGGALVLARSDRDLLDLAEGKVPSAWRIPTPPDYPALATPSEALGVFEGIAGGAISTEPGEWHTAVQQPASAEPPRPPTPPSSLTPATRGRREGEGVARL